MHSVNVAYLFVSAVRILCQYGYSLSLFFHKYFLQVPQNLIAIGPAIKHDNCCYHFNRKKWYSEYYISTCIWSIMLCQSSSCV